uniref:Uncharacterized protein n=1 Tax=Chromera velia CCMP2878 TaxID=1169474 RepID=A0A0G4FEM1_9ALVE|eukprot:Cvel_16486.t1-p1 / transcript=Cvel_16486.t1 / gene=Cvel_16486 / organism=Chromera_velia_CCMP2878 / gene_product=hypothetical protein / transcript_product=hypothetical protein / location=Cvel_scaffold1271:17068-23523(-) / protein_length=161 / sequence_SO=supercontig / SO=protein_coding / is_pseudo=false
MCHQSLQAVCPLSIMQRAFSQHMDFIFDYLNVKQRKRQGRHRRTVYASKECSVEGEREKSCQEDSGVVADAEDGVEGDGKEAGQGHVLSLFLSIAAKAWEAKRAAEPGTVTQVEDHEDDTEDDEDAYDGDDDDSDWEPPKKRPRVAESKSSSSSSSSSSSL